jgi:hypothetical protein
MGGYVFYDKEFDLEEISNASILKKIQMLIPVSVKNVSLASYDYLDKKNENKEKVSIALEFLEFNLPEIISTADSISSFGFQLFEVRINLYRALYLSSIGFYKEAIINLRSALELTLFLTSYYMVYRNCSNGISCDDFLKCRDEKLDMIKNWLESKEEKKGKEREFDTPLKGKSFDIFKNIENFKLFDKTNFKDDCDCLYKKLCNFTHTKGVSNSHLKHTNFRVHNIDLPPVYNEEVLKQFFDLFIEVMQFIAILSVTARPELLNEEAAYQVEIQTGEPLIGSGLWGKAASIFFNLIPDDYKEHFKQYHITVENE